MNGAEKYRTYAWRYERNDLKFCPRCGERVASEDLHIEDQPQLVCDACRFIFYLDPKLVVTAVVISPKGLLLLKRAEPPCVGKWGLPGGHLTRGENVELAARNEVLEEAGLDVTIGGLLGLTPLPDNQGIQLIFSAHTSETTAVPNLESTEARFFEEAAIPWLDLAFASTRIALELALRNSPVVKLGG